MPVTSRDIPPEGNDGEPMPPPWSEARYWCAGAVGLALLVLLLRTFFPPVVRSPVVPTPPAPAPTHAPLAVVIWTPVAELAIAPAAPATAPTRSPTASATAPAPASPLPATPGCPAAAALPEGARAGWLARAAGCPDVLFAVVHGEHRWVLRPTDFPDDLAQSLPEVQP